MEKNVMTVEPRKVLGKGPARRLRREGKVPGVMYGLGRHQSIMLDPGALQKVLLSESGMSQILTLSGAELDGKKALVKDYDIDPVTRKLLHVDLLEVDITKKVTVTVKLNYVGKAAGVVDGGILNIVERDVEIRCLPDNIPGHIDVDVTNLKIADSIHLSELVVPDGVEKIMTTNLTLVTVVPPISEEELAPALEAAAEPEVLTEKKKEGEEGEAAAAGDEKAAAPKDKAKEKEEKKEKK